MPARTTDPFRFPTKPPCMSRLKTGGSFFVGIRRAGGSRREMLREVDLAALEPRADTGLTGAVR